MTHRAKVRSVAVAMVRVRRGWRTLAAAAVVVVVASSLAAQSDSAPELPVEVLHTPGTLAQGDPLSAYVTSAAPLAEFELAVELADGERVAGSGFAVRRGPAGTTWAAVLGIPSNAPAGEARLTISGLLAGSASRAETRVMLHEQPLVIGEREFAVEEIPLNTGLSNLRRTTDPQRKTESWELWLLLSASRPVAWPHYGPLRLPLGDVRRTGGFGDRRLYRYADGNTATTIHNGVDFGVPTGTVVAAAGGGTVAMARERIVTGFTVVIEHLPGVYSLYYHLDGLAVREGQRVFAGEPIGTVGSTGLATGPHLHWEVRAAGVAVDPDLLVAAPLVDLPDD